MAKKNLLKEANEIIEAQLEQIDEQIDYLNTRLQIYDKIKEKRDRLLAARRALIGGNKLTGAGGSKLTMQDIVGFIEENGPARPADVAKKFGVTQTVVSSHFYRHKDRFLKHPVTGQYHLRDPKNGINTEDDLVKEDDE